MKSIACNARPGAGGLGRHFAELLADLRNRDELGRYYSTALDPDDVEHGEAVSLRFAAWLSRFTPVRFSPGWKAYVEADLFDRLVAARLRPELSHIGFAGQSLRTFRRARELGVGTLILVAATSHVSNVARRLAQARRLYPIEGVCLNKAHVKKTLREYELADVILVASEYTRQTFLDEGVQPERLRRFDLTVARRFSPEPPEPQDEVFRVVYVGSLIIRKGIPVLVDAFSRLRNRRAELVLVGGWGTRGMRRYLERARSLDPRITITAGDPLPHLRQANVYVQPSFEDGFGYAPMEALKCGVPVIVTEDTGMKEHVRHGENGYVVPTGSCEAILERLEDMEARRLGNSSTIRFPETRLGSGL